MLSIFEITIAFILGILWGLYLETKFLFMASIFLYFFVLVFCNKYNLISAILLMIVLLSCNYTNQKVKDFDTKYSDDLAINMKITIITHLEERNYTYKYQGKNEQGDKFIFYFKKSKNSKFKVGDIIQVIGEFSLPDVARNMGGFNNRRYLNSNGIYGTVLVSYFEVLSNEFKPMNFVYMIQNKVHENFQKILLKEKARNIKWNANSVKPL